MADFTIYKTRRQDKSRKRKSKSECNDVFIAHGRILLSFNAMWLWPSQDSSARQGVRAHAAALSPPSAALAPSSLFLDRPHVTAARQVIEGSACGPMMWNYTAWTKVNSHQAVQHDTWLCPGFYCVKGSSAPTACPAGSVNPLARRTSLADCSACPSGFFCNSSGQPEPTGPCSAGLAQQIVTLMYFLVL